MRMSKYIQVIRVVSDKFYCEVPDDWPTNDLEALISEIDDGSLGEGGNTKYEYEVCEVVAVPHDVLHDYKATDLAELCEEQGIDPDEYWDRQEQWKETKKEFSEDEDE